MTESPQTTAVLRLLGCGVPSRHIRPRLQALPADNRDRLVRVARRVWLTRILRYHTSVDVPLGAPEERFLLTHVELPSLEIYLLFTCIDTLASPSYTPFPSWLKKQPGEHVWNLTEIETLLQAYHQECGVGSNLRRAFASLPPALLEWLHQNVRVERADVSGSPLQALAPAPLTEHLGQYYYSIRRNLFTHAGTARLTYISPDTYLSDGWFTPASTMAYTIRNRTWTMRLRNGLDEATLLRVILQALALRQLGIEMTQDVIDAFMTSLARLSALYGFADEVEQNSLLIRAWLSFAEDRVGLLNDYIAAGGVPRLRTEWPTVLAERLNTDYPLERGLKEWVLLYLHDVLQLNAAVDSFNHSHPAGRATWPARSGLTKAFLSSLSADAAFAFVQDAATAPQVMNLRLITRDPCYT